MDEAIRIGADHGGVELKSAIIDWLSERNISVVDCGTNSTEIVRYPHFAAQVVAPISRGESKRGILICSTGIGMSIIANRYHGVRASLCTSTYMAKMTRAHNDSNVLCLGGKITGPFEALDILETWLTTPFEGGRHTISLGLIEEAGAAMSSGNVWQPEVPGKTQSQASQ